MRITLKVNAGQGLEAGAVINDIFLRQPLQCCAGRSRQGLYLTSQGTGAAVKFARCRGREQGMSAGVKLGLQAQFIAADHPARGMENGDMAKSFPFWVKRSLHLQGALMRTSTQNSALVPTLKTERQMSLPAGGEERIIHSIPR